MNHGRLGLVLVVLGAACGSDPPGAGTEHDASSEGKNACGGDTPLTFIGRAASPADRCGACGTGALVCAGPTVLMCAGSLDASCPEGGATNACGGQGALLLDGRTAIPGEKCGPCRDGTVICTAANAVTCVGAIAGDVAVCSASDAGGDVLLDRDASRADAPSDAPSSATDAKADLTLVDATGVDAPRDGAFADVTVGSSDVAEPNACGGMRPALWRGIPAKPGSACGPCGWRLRCASLNFLVCGGSPSSTTCPADAGPNDSCEIPPSAYTTPRPTVPDPPTESAPIATTATAVALSANSLVYNPFDFRLYASVGSQQGPEGNSIAVIDPYAGTIVRTIFVGSEPKKIALSDDGTTLWVALDGAGAVRRVDLPSATAGLQFSFGADHIGAVWYPRDVAVLPGSRDSVVVTRYSKASSGDDGLIVYDNGVPRAYSTEYETYSATGPIVTYAPALVFGHGPMSTACVNVNGIFKKPSTFPITVTQGRFSFANNVIYTAAGAAYDIASKTTSGAYAGRGSVAADATKRRVWFLSDSQAATISAYDMDTFAAVGSETLSVGTSSIGDNLVLWGRFGYAFRAGAQIVIARSTLAPTSTAPSPR